MISTLKKAALATILLAGASGVMTATPAAHAAAGAQPVRSMYCIPCYHPPTLSATGSGGQVYISGSNWPANSWVNVDVYMPVWAGGGVTQLVVFTNSYGGFSTTWHPLGFCFYGQVEVQAYNGTTNLAVYPVPGCIG
jgi:hypothetical protein